MSLVGNVERVLFREGGLKGSHPPVAFGNAMAEIYPKGWDTTNWWKLSEWKLFLAGYMAASADAKHAVDQMATTAFVIKRETL